MRDAWLNGILGLIGFNDPKAYPKSAADVIKSEPKAMNKDQWKAMINLVLGKDPTKAKN